MSVDSLDSLSYSSDNDFLDVEDTAINWNGRTVSIGNITNTNPNISLLSYNCRSQPAQTDPFWGYFNSEAKKQNEFDLAVYQYHIRCNSEESKRALESSFEKMASGMVGIVVGVILCMPPLSFAGLASGGPLIYNCNKKIWQGVDDFKRAMDTSGVNLDDVRFVTWYENYKKNSDEMTSKSILQPWKPLDQSGFELMDKEYNRKLLDPTFNPWAYA